jgi:hypothetical protein
MSSSGILRRVVLVRTYVTEELSASFIRVTEPGELMLEALISSDTSVITRATQLSIQKDGILHSHCRETSNLTHLNTFRQVRFDTIMSVTVKSVTFLDETPQNLKNVH